MVHEKLLCLLPGGKQQALTSDRVFEPFAGLNPLHYNPYTEVGGLDCMCTFVLNQLQEKPKEAFCIVFVILKTSLSKLEKSKNLLESCG